MLFLALRQHPDHCLPRAQLINSALELDTPANSASASLTKEASQPGLSWLMSPEMKEKQFKSIRNG
ncbi:hypothetical protein RMCBS344292_15714 [Rhizopus microsporus]|nr:hypothetical protein RMCBS344292_15714 [Rhizopus microsporus]